MKKYKQRLPIVNITKTARAIKQMPEQKRRDFRKNVATGA